MPETPRQGEDEERISDGIWCVLLFNNDVTPMEFVAYLLRRVFRKDIDEAQQIVLETHEHGIAICAVYDRREDAAAKIAEASTLGREHGFSVLFRYCCGGTVLKPMVSRGAMINWLRGIDKLVWRAFWQGG